MFRSLFSIIFFITSIAVAQMKVEEGSDIRILELLPRLDHPPLVDPCLPQDFTLGEREEDTHYYWGSKGTISDYFTDPKTLKGCLIRAQLSNKVTQVGLDRFSSDGDTKELTAAGFTQIQVKRGKWGIFPYREIHAKGSKGRHYYQMWVGLNSDDGSTLVLQFLYPDYLNEPTQNQKKIWDDFVRKTSLLSISDLLVVHGVHMKQGYTETKGIHERVRIAVEKRRFDQKLFIYIEPLTDIHTHIEIQNLQDINSLSAFAKGKPLVEIDSLITESTGETITEKVRVLYDIVDQFTFNTQMLSANRFEESPNYLLFQ